MSRPVEVYRAEQNKKYTARQDVERDNSGDPVLDKGTHIFCVLAGQHRYDVERDNESTNDKEEIHSQPPYPEIGYGPRCRELLPAPDLHDMVYDHHGHGQGSQKID